MYPDGHNVDQIIAAAEKGDARAAFNLGWRYYIGNGIHKDKSKACHWYSQAASWGIREAGEILAVLQAQAQREPELAALCASDIESGRCSRRTIAAVSTFAGLVVMGLVVLASSLLGDKHVKPAEHAPRNNSSTKTAYDRSNLITNASTIAKDTTNLERQAVTAKRSAARESLRNSATGEDGESSNQGGTTGARIEPNHPKSSGQEAHRTIKFNDLPKWLDDNNPFDNLK